MNLVCYEEKKSIFPKERYESTPKCCINEIRTAGWDLIFIHKTRLLLKCWTTKTIAVFQSIVCY